jgi:uncharacterized membrane protein
LLLAALAAVPAVLLAWRNLAALGGGRRLAALILRALVILLLAVLLAGPSLNRQREQVTLVTVMDRSLSIPDRQRAGSLAFLKKALAEKPAGDKVAVVDVAERAVIERLPSTGAAVNDQAPSLSGQQSNLAGGIQLAMAIAPPDTAVRFLLVSDGNETVGDLREAARLAAANHIPIDVLGLHYKYDREVVFRRLVAPPVARSRQTIPLRFVLDSRAEASGTLTLRVNDDVVRLNADPASKAEGLPIQLKPGTNVKTIQMPVGTKGLYRFEATFVPDDPAMDTLTENNRASAVTFIAGPGRILVVDAEGTDEGRPIAEALEASAANADNLPFTVHRIKPRELPTELAQLLDTDAVILVNVANGEDFSPAQQQVLLQYVEELGGGLVMTGGPNSFGAGGWIGSPLATILPVDMDPAQRKEMPKGALVLIMHSCEMPDGNYWGKQIATAAAKVLSAKDLVGVMSYSWNDGGLWDFPLAPAGDKSAVNRAITQMQLGDMPDFGAPMQAALQALKKCDAVQKHVIIISDGDPQMPTNALLTQYKNAGVTVTGVVVYPHPPDTGQSLQIIAKTTGGRFYNVTDPNKLPQIFVKEAQTIRRTLIVEKVFVPKLTGSTNEILRGIAAVPDLSGYVLTTPKQGLAELLMVGGADNDPILAAQQAGVGRCVAFTSTADSRWAAKWKGWGGFDRFWEQVVRWVGKSSQSSDCEVAADVQGRQVTLTVDAQNKKGEFLQFSQITARTIGPNLEPREVLLTQVGPGQYRGTFMANESGDYLVNLKYTQVGSDGQGRNGMFQTVVSVPYAPEYVDLTDNGALLAEVAQETGGRVLTADPQAANLFTRAGLAFPLEPLPTVKPLIILWLILFLLDVAVRRVALDVVALARRSKAWTVGLFSRRPAEESEALDALKRRKTQVRRQMLPKEQQAAAGRRFEVSPEAKPAALPDEEFLKPAAGPLAKAKPAEGPKPAAEATEESNLNRLLEAKRRAKRDTGKDESQEKKE